MNVVFQDFPHPLRQSEIIKTVYSKKTGKSWIADSREYKAYRAQVVAWTLKRAREIQDLRNRLKYELASEQYILIVDSFFGMPPADYWYKKGHVRELDASNYLKCLHDSLVNVLGVDDRYFGIRAEKVLLSRHEKERKLFLRIRTQKVRTSEEILCDFYPEDSDE